MLVNTTLLLTEITSFKELFDYTEKELNLSIFNSTTPITFQLEVYKFLKKVFDVRISANLSVGYNPKHLKNLYQKTNKVREEKIIYSIDEYLTLIDYAKDVKRHKQRAIQDIHLQIKNEKHNHRDSSWLYVLLHLNNAWRHYDVTSFPRICLKKTRIGDMAPLDALNWIEKNNLNNKEITVIINQVKRMSFVHSKTKKPRHFFCSETLSSAFVHSLVLCELRCQIDQPLSEVTIDFRNYQRTFRQIYQKAFFKGHDPSFIFRSKQMNRTLISYIYSVIKKTTNRNPLEITKYVRGHASQETTNVYIDIPQEQMDFITNQLFDLGNFGYAYDALAKMLLPGTASNREEQNKNSLLMKKVFGDVYHIEQMVRYLNRLAADQQTVRQVIEGFSILEKQELFNLIKLGQQPAKKEGFQCVYSACKFPLRDCEKCSFAIPNFYALSQLSSNFYSILNEVKKKFSTTSEKGEQIRLSNILYSYLHLIGHAVKKFGKETVSDFFENGLDGVKDELALIPSMKDYLTIPHVK